MASLLRPYSNAGRPLWSGGILVREGRIALLGLEGPEHELDRFVCLLAGPPYSLAVEIPWRLSVSGPRYRQSTVSTPVLTPGEGEWLQMEIESGFSDLGTLPTLMDWLALRQTELDHRLWAGGRTAGRKTAAT